MSVRQILKSREIIGIVPDARKAAAVKACLDGAVSPAAPASILQTHANTTLYLDRESAALLAPADPRRDPGVGDAHESSCRGFFDLQVNGFGGVDFNGPDLTGDRVGDALERMRATGVTRCLPTLITSSFERFAASARVLARVADPAIAGIHMEGPYLSPEDGARGAHPRDARAAGERSTTSAAARTPQAGASCSSRSRPKCRARLRSSSTWSRPASASRSATRRRRRSRSPTRSRPARRSPRIWATAAAQMLPRHPNVIWELLAADAVFASLIVDGHHLPPSTVKAMVRAKGPATGRFS